MEDHIAFKAGDIVKLRGGVTPLIIVSVAGSMSYCAPLPYRFGEPVVTFPSDALEHCDLLPIKNTAETVVVEERINV